MIAAPDLFLMRHGQTVWNAEGRLHGGLDSDLTPLGLRQARWQADLIAGQPGSRLSSPQGRARRTAQILFAPGGFDTDPDLAEIGIGTFAGHLTTDLAVAHPDLFTGGPLDWYDRCPGGEGLAALALRCRGLLDRLRGPALIVSHGITLRMLWALAIGAAPDAAALAQAPLWQGAVLVVRGGKSSLWRHPDDHR